MKLEWSTLNNTLYIVVPCYNEEAVLPETAVRLRDKLNALTDAGKISPASRILFVNDGSRDATWQIICRLHGEDKRFSGVSLSRNRGHQYALLAGLMTAKDRADMTISIDADLQDDLDAIDAMVDKYLHGYEIVYGVRSSRASDTGFKRGTALSFYRMMQKLGAEIVYNHADFRLMGKRALEALSAYKEQSLFLRGIVPMLGFRTATVEYVRSARFAGESKYTLRKMLALAADGVTSLSLRPLRWILGAAGLLFLLALIPVILGVVSLCRGMPLSDRDVLAFCIFFVGGIVLAALGIVGEYVGKTLLEAKARPRYFISEIVHDDE